MPNPTKGLGVLVCLLLLCPALGQAQTAATGSLSGTVTDPTGAVVPGAEVVLQDTATNLSRTQQSSVAGQYLFVGVVPGVYRITVRVAGFRQAVVPSVKVEVAKSFIVDVALQIGQTTDSVEVTAGAGVELQTTDATVGNVIRGVQLLRLPNVNRNALVFFGLQPLVSPQGGVGIGNNQGGQVAGARSDQTSFSLDGGDVSDNMVGFTFTQPSGIGVEPAIPIPAESVEEFRGGTTNPNATFGRSSGGQISFVTKRGSNSFHGSAYWYHQNDNLNANTWDRNRLRQKNPELKDNRYGFSVGGPIWKDHSFFFANYEGRRFGQSADVSRLVPTASLRAGTLRFRDTSGVVRDYPLATSTQCGPTNTIRCDPRGLGISPVINRLWALLPEGNNPTLGDGLNTIGFSAPVPIPQESDFGVLRLDHHFSPLWLFNGTFRYSRATLTEFGQVDIGGLLPGHKIGQPASTSQTPLVPRYIAAGLTGQLTPRFTNEFRFAWVRDWWERGGRTPFPQVPGTTGALQVASTLVDEPIDVTTGPSRTLTANNRNFQFINNATWVRGRHTLQFGGTLRHILFFEGRNDKVVGSLAALVAEIDAGSAVQILPTNRPPDCTAAVRTNCLASGDATRWNRLFAGATGMMDNISVLIVRDGNLKPLPVGEVLTNYTKNNAYEFYFSDIWRVRPSLTISAGLNYQWQTPPVEEFGRSTFMIDAGSGEILTSEKYLENRRKAAEAGTIYNPVLGYQLLKNSTRKRIFDVDRKNLGPRVAIAWNPSSASGLQGRLLGDRKTVLRGGYSLVFDRLNTVQTVILPILGVGFAQTVNCRGPLTDGTCSNSSNPANAFRVGVDGAGPIPAIPTVASPVVPQAPFGEIISFQGDPDISVGRSHVFSFTIQRQLKGDTLLEFGYVGRLGRNLNQNKQLNSVPYFMVDAASKQTFAQAFDAIADQIRAGVLPSAVRSQPWFENLIGPGGTVDLATREAVSFRDGQLDNLWNTIQVRREARGLPPITNRQVQDLWMRTDGGRSNYHAAFVTFHKRASRGLTFDLNYTFSKALDQIGQVQNTTTTFSNSYFPDLDYGPALFDRRHVFNADWVYDLPLGRGRRFSTGNWADNVIGGWHLSGIFTAFSGLPTEVAQGNHAYGGDPLTFSPNSGAIALQKPDYGHDVHRGVAGSGGVGANGDPAVGGSGLSLYGNPEAVLANFRRIRLAEDGRSGRGVLRGMGRWNVDLSLGKRTAVTERVNLLLSFDFLNAFNHVEFADPELNMLNPRAFGVLTRQFNRPRAIQASLRVEF